LIYRQGCEARERFKWRRAAVAGARLPRSMEGDSSRRLLGQRLTRRKRRIKTQTVLPSADTAAMLFWALLARGATCQIL
jgi:hypothetical protein